jgi:hypothetical protein
MLLLVKPRVWAFAIVTALGSAVMLGVYLAILRSQGNDPVGWVIATLVWGIVLPLVGAAVPRLGPACFALCAIPLTALSLLGIFSIGLLIAPFAAVAWLGAGAAHSRTWLDNHRQWPPPTEP